MKNEARKLLVLSVAASSLTLAGCNGTFMTMAGVSVGSSSLPTTPLTPAAGPSPAPIVAGNGGNFSGTGSLSVPTAAAISIRITNGLQNNVSPLSGNFGASLKLIQSNLPQVSDPTKASGFDQIELLAYAACSDLTTGTPSKMTSVYGVTPTASITSSQSALVAAGMKMMNQYTANLSSSEPASDQVTAALNKLVTTIAQLPATDSPTTTMAFVSVCLAANTAGSALLGF